ncbi:MAG: hypothetical protein H6729_02210 [Deltaproteobacteria bacterium]|nr:hypothetical protein [Deltaproteobacteria bacterium]
MIGPWHKQNKACTAPGSQPRLFFRLFLLFLLAGLPLPAACHNSDDSALLASAADAVDVDATGSVSDEGGQDDGGPPDEGSDGAPWLSDDASDGGAPSDLTDLGDNESPGDNGDADDNGDGSTTIDDASTSSSGAHPFGQHAGYPGRRIIFPSGTPTDLDRATESAYDRWKTKYLQKACLPGQYRIHTAPSTATYTVSEGHGYAMIIVALMAGHDPDARAIFDGLHGYFLAHPSHKHPNLMAWAQNKKCQDVEGADSATDGDLDIAYALLLAHSQWGDSGGIDRLKSAKNVIAAALDGEIHPMNSILVGDWANDPSDDHYEGTRPSDFLLQHFKAFALAAGEPRWDEVVEKTYATIDYLQDHYAPSTGLLPDFAVDAPTTTPRPAPANWLEGTDDGAYAWNACRTPWRIGTDYLISGDARSQVAVQRMTQFFRTASHDDPRQITPGYALSGTSLDPQADPELAFLAPLAVAAMIEPDVGTNRPWLDALWGVLVSVPESDYYGDTLRLLAMIVVSGNWWAP